MILVEVLIKEQQSNGELQRTTLSNSLYDTNRNKLKIQTPLETSIGENSLRVYNEITA